MQVENFDQLASLLADFPALTATTTFIFVPGDNDPWASTFSGGSSTILPRKGIPDIFTSRIKRVFQQSSKGASDGTGGEALWTSNPCRIGYFTQELVICRDDVVGRLRRNGINFKKSDDDDRKEDDKMDEAQDGAENEEDPDIDHEVRNARKVPPSPPPSSNPANIITASQDDPRPRQSVTVLARDSARALGLLAYAAAVSAPERTGAV